MCFLFYRGCITFLCPSEEEEVNDWQDKSLWAFGWQVNLAAQRRQCHIAVSGCVGWLAMATAEWQTEQVRLSCSNRASSSTTLTLLTYEYIHISLIVEHIIARKFNSPPGKKLYEPAFNAINFTVLLTHLKICHGPCRPWHPPGFSTWAPVPVNTTS